MCYFTTVVTLLRVAPCLVGASWGAGEHLKVPRCRVVGFLLSCRESWQQPADGAREVPSPAVLSDGRAGSCVLPSLEASQLFHGSPGGTFPRWESGDLGTGEMEWLCLFTPSP